MLHLRFCLLALLSCCCNLVVVDALKGSSKHYDVLTSLSQPSRRRLQNNDKNNNNDIKNINNNKNNDKDGTAAPTLSPPPSSPPSLTPSIAPSASPTTTPSLPPSFQPSIVPTPTPTATPSQYPSNTPTLSPSIPPSALPSPFPSAYPSVSMIPSSEPTSTLSPTVSLLPSVVPSQSPRPSVAPSLLASEAPSASAAPSFDTATDPPSNAPSFLEPTSAPSLAPTRRSTVLPLRDFTLFLDDPNTNATSLIFILQPYLYNGLRREAFPSMEDPYLSALYLQPAVVLDNDNGERRSVRRGLQQASSTKNITLGGFVWFQGTNLPTLTELHNAQAQVLSLENTRLVATVQNELGVQITDVQLLEMDTTRDIPTTQNDNSDDDKVNVGYIIGGIAGGILVALVGVMGYHRAVRSREPPLPDSPQTILPVDYNPAEDHRQVRSAIVEPDEAQPSPPPPLPSVAKPTEPQQQRAQPSASEQQPPGNTHLASATVTPPAVSKPVVENNPKLNEPVQSPVTLAAPAVLSTPLASTMAPVVQDNSDEHAVAAAADGDDDNDEDSMAGFSLMTTPAPAEPTPQERSTVKRTNATAAATKYYKPHSVRTKYSKFSTPNVVENSDDDDESQFTYAKIGDDSSMLYGSAQRSYVAGADELRLKSNLTSPSAAAAASKTLMSGIAPTSPERNSLPTDERGQDDEQDLEGFARELESIKTGTNKTNNENVRNRPGGKEKQQRRQVKL